MIPRKTTGYREACDEIVEALSIPGVLVGIELLEGTLQPQGGQGGRRTVTRTDDMDHFQAMILDGEGQM
jgi:hypothetical protein